MTQGGLIERLRDLGGAPGPFDPADDLQLDAAARHLLERFQRENDTDAFTLLFELTHTKLSKIASRITRRLSPQLDPEELASGFMTRLFTDVHGRRREPVRHFLGLAHTAMRNEVLDQLRRDKRTQVFVRRYADVLPDSVDPSKAAECAEEDALLGDFGQELVDLTDSCFHDLDRRDKQVLIAREVLHLSYDRVARMLDLNELQIGMVIRRARQHLADSVVERLGELPEGAANDTGRRLVLSCLASKERVKNVRGLVQQMLDASLRAGRRRLADLLYEMAKACLLEVPRFAERTLVDSAPRRREEVASEIAQLSARLKNVDAEQLDLGTLSASQRQDRLASAELCLGKLAMVEGESGRQQVALALQRIYAERLDEAERLLLGLVDRDLPPITRQNVFRNLTLCLLRQERWDEALTVCHDGADEWPEDPVRLMNTCFATARLGRIPDFEDALLSLALVHTAEPQLRVAAWLDGECRALAHDLALPPHRVDDLLRMADPGQTKEEPQS